MSVGARAAHATAVRAGFTGVGAAVVAGVYAAHASLAHAVGAFGWRSASLAVRTESAAAATAVDAGFASVLDAVGAGGCGAPAAHARIGAAIGVDVAVERRVARLARATAVF